MEKLVREALEPLDIPLFFKVIPKNAEDEVFDEYVMFGVYNVKRLGREDDTYTMKRHYITLNYWYSDSLNRIDEIASLLEESGFEIEDETDLEDSGLYGRNYDIAYTEYL
ncbi:MAG: hypothetical protein KIB00_16875 [Paeniclostridium sordellii]|nr:hypothetical protein [Paeniclostridium sordellii]